MIREGEIFPNLFLIRPDGTNLDLFELRKKEHAVIVFADMASRDFLAFSCCRACASCQLIRS